MRELFNIIINDFNPNSKCFIRPSSRCIYIKDNKIAMVHSILYDYYKFPGGGIESNESNIDALIRETLEEAGLEIIKESIKEYGLVRRIEKGIKDDYDYFIQDNYYYICECFEEIHPQSLDEYENKEQFTLEFVDYKIAIDKNRNKNHGPKSQIMIERESKVLEFLVKEGYLK